MGSVTLVWATPEIDKNLAYIARVSNPANQGHLESAPKLIRYMLDNGPVSPFEMANVCLEINCPRDIGRQILRHRSFNFQEFSQRYQRIDQLPPARLREARLQDTKNRQNSLATNDDLLNEAWCTIQEEVKRVTDAAYKWALDMNIAKECARVVLPEGLTSSRLYMNGTIRSWIFYLKQRLDPSTQKEHREIAEQVLFILQGLCPDTMGAAGPWE